MSLHRMAAFSLSLSLVAAFASATATAAPTEKKPSEIEASKTSEWTERDYKAARDRDDARQKLWDKKMKALTGSICTGC